MNPWILQQGFPVISVSNSDPVAGARLVQRPFNDRRDLPPSPYNYSWPIPLFVNSYVGGGGNTELRWLAPGAPILFLTPRNFQPMINVLQSRSREELNLGISIG
jgi:hypothetical protein